MTASGARVNLRSPAIAHTRSMDWQQDAWNYRDSVDELRFAAEFVANSLGQLRVYAAENRPRGEDPVPLDTTGTVPQGIAAAGSIEPHTRECANALVDRLNLNQQGSHLLGQMAENFDLAGECYLLGEAGEEGEEWTIRSKSELIVTAGGARLVDPAGGTPRELRADDCDVLRLWNPHPRWQDQPDSPVRAMLGTLEGMSLVARRGRAHDRSRISNGMALYLPWEFSLMRAGDAGTVDEDADPALAALAEAMVTPIRDEEDPSAVVPVVIRGDAMIGDRPAADVIKTIQLHGDDPAKLDDRYEALVKRFSRGINLSQERVTGLGSTNHWNGALITTDELKMHVRPRAIRLVDSLTVAYLWAGMRAMGVRPDQRRKVCLWFDPQALVENPNREDAAQAVHDSGALSDEALRRHRGFTDDDKPDPLEQLRRAVDRERLSPASVPILVKLLTGQMPSQDDIDRVLTDYSVSGRPVRSRPLHGQPGGQPQALNPAPSQPKPQPAAPTGVTAAGISAGISGGRFHVDEQACRKLAQIDRALTDRLLAHAESTVGRAVERAANRIRGRAQKDPILAAAFKGSDPVAVCAAAGRDVQGDVSDDDALAGALDEFALRWEKETTHAAEQVAAVVTKMAGSNATTNLLQRLVEGARRGWDWLRGRLQNHITAVLYGETDADPVPTSLVRGALTIAGGIPEQSAGIDDTGTPVTTPGQEPARHAGPATGQTTSRALADGGAEQLGWTWGYWGAPRKDPFPPHVALDGRRFDGFTDPGLVPPPQAAFVGPFMYPGDHDGCLCSIEMIWATPTGEDRSTSEGRDLAALDETPQMRQIRELAEADDAAGRTGTTAQRDRDTAAEIAALRRQHIGAREGSSA